MLGITRGYISPHYLRFRGFSEANRPSCFANAILYIWLHCLVGYIDQPEYWWAPTISPYYLVDVPIGIPLYHTMIYPDIPICSPLKFQFHVNSNVLMIKISWKQPTKKTIFQKDEFPMSIWIVGSFQVKLQEDFAEVFPLVLRFWYGLPASRIVSVQHAGDTEKCREIILFYEFYMDDITISTIFGYRLSTDTWYIQYIYIYIHYTVYNIYIYIHTCKILQIFVDTNE